jgi:hypothetical protein
LVTGGLVLFFGRNIYEADAKEIGIHAD